MKLFSLVKNISGDCIKFPKVRFKKSVVIDMCKTKNQCKIPQVAGTTDSTPHTGK